MYIDLQLINQILIVVLNLIGVWLVFWVYSSDRKKTLNKGFALLLLPNLLWINFYVLASFFNQYDLSLFLTRLTFASTAIFFIGFYYFFIIWFLEEKSYYPLIGKLVIVYEVIFSLLCAFTSLVIPTIEFGKFGIIPIFSIFGKITFYFFVITLVILVITRLIINYYKSTRIVKNKIQYFLIGVFIFTASNFVIGIILPGLFNAQDYYFVTSYSTLFLFAFTSYAIVKHHLMDIRMVVARSLSYSLLLIILAGGYALAIFGAQTYIFSDQAYTSGQTVVQVILAIIMAFTFQPLRKFLTKVTDKIFFKHDYDLQKVLKRLTNIANATLNLVELLYKTTDLLIKEVKVSRGLFVLLDEKGSVFTAQSVHYNKHPELNNKEMVRIAKRGITVFEELKEKNRSKKILKRFNASVSLGLKDEQGRPLGVLFLGEKESGDMFNTKDKRLFEVLMPELSIAIHRTREHEKIAKFNITLQQEVARQTKELSDKNNKLRELDKAKDEFISMASHQLRTPLTAIKGYLSMLLEGDAGEIKMAQYDFVTEAYNGASRMVGLINDLLNVSRMETGRFFIEPVDVDLSTMVEEEIKQLTNHAKDKKLYLKLEKKKTKIPKVKADETKLRQVVMNFIDNAIYYTQEGGVTVSLDTDSKNIIFKVKDTGIGVPKAQQKNLFTKFYRADNARRARPDGTGLGIYLAKKVMNDHDGEILFESEEGKGSTFGFKMPLKAKFSKKLTTPPPDLAIKSEHQEVQGKTVRSEGIADQKKGKKEKSKALY